MNDAEKDARLQTLDERIAQYRVFASFFLQLPTVEGLQSVRSELQLAFGADADGLCGNGNAPEGMELLASFFQEAQAAGKSDNDLLSEVAVDRTFLVRGISERGPKPPYASLYAQVDQGTSMFSLKEFYRCAGIAVSESVHEAPDYLGLELDCMRALLEHQKAALLAGDDEKAELYRSKAAHFLPSHVAPLARCYVQEVLPHAKTGYCAGMLQLLDDFMVEESGRKE